MIDPRKNRIDYGDKLIPPEGYNFSYAVGTTYSLNIETLLLLPGAFLYSESLESNVNRISNSMLDAIIKVSRNVRVYCQKGKIHVPENYHPLLAYWENSIEEIRMPSAAHSFHPKVWVIRYEAKKDKQEVIYRLIVTSRNLCFTRDWDLAFCSEGMVSSADVQRTKPLVHFLEYLDLISKEKLPKEFISDLRKVEFEVPEGFKLINFFPIGIPDRSGTKYQNPLSKKSWDELLIVSPFVQDNAINNLCDKINKYCYVLSRKEELDALKDKIFEEIYPYYFNPSIEQGEFFEDNSESAELAKYQGLHAKLFIGKKNDSSHWYLGSANATDPAFERNVEFLVEMKGEGNKQSLNTILDLLTTERRSDVILFEEYDRRTKQDQSELKKNEILLRNIVYNLSNQYISGIAEADPLNDTKYNIELRINTNKLNLPKGFTVKIKPLSLDDRESKSIDPGIFNHIYFNDVTEIQLSTFIVWEVYFNEELQKQFVVQIDIKLPESRYNKIFSAVLDTKEKLLSYLLFLLTGEDRSGDMVNGKNGPTIILTSTGVPVFEKIMLMISRNPERLKSINDFIERVKTENPETAGELANSGFDNFWSTLRKYREKSQ